jgi:20S proteasome alpha/beta subunit
MTCVIGGKCKDGIVIVSDRKITYKDHPTDYREKIHKLGSYPIITAGAGGAAAYNKFRMKLTPELQSQTSVWDNAHVSGITVQMYGTTGDNFASYQTKIVNTLKQVNVEENHESQIELLIAIQIADHDAIFTHIDTSGYTSDCPYKAIGTGGQYAYVFMKPSYDEDILMNEFARVGYFAVKFLDKFEIDPDVGLDRNSSKHNIPQIWFMPNHGTIYTLEERHDLSVKYETDTNIMIQNFKQNGINALLPQDDVSRS